MFIAQQPDLVNQLWGIINFLNWLGDFFYSFGNIWHFKVDPNLGFKSMSNTEVYKSTESIWMISRSHSIHLLMPEIKQSRSPFRVCAGASLRPRVRGAPAGWPGCWTRWSSTSEHTVSGATINKGRKPHFPCEQLTNKDRTRQKNRKTDKMKDRQTRQKYGPTEKK